jgi:hypothetical protein
MKKNLNEQVTRIKQMMGINEDRVDLNTYNDETSIIEDIKRVGTTNDGNPITSMMLNTFIPNVGSETEGNKVKIEIIIEWKPNDATKFKSYRNGKRVYEYRVKSIVDIKSDVELDRELLNTIRRVFVNHPTPYDLVNRIYMPYHQKFGNVNFDSIYNNVKKDKEELEDVLSGEPHQQAEPEVQDAPEKETKKILARKFDEKPQVDVAPEKETNKLWTSTSSWASE